MNYLPIIGLEVHVQPKTKSKMFCGCAAGTFGAKPNTLVCPVCLGLPGALPVPNRQVLQMTVRLGLALGGQVVSPSYFERKNYFYPDLPKGYQISQYKEPLCRGGSLVVGEQKVHINRVHQEEDTAKLIHRLNHTLIDFNRSGVPLTEIVTEPEIHSAAEAKEFLKALQRLIRYLGISDADMEKGSMRLEANISLKKLKTPRPRRGDAEGGQNSKLKATTQSSKVGSDLPNYRIELKNINSFRFVEKALNYEIKRQTEALERGEKLVQETRGWDEARQCTFVQRTKEEAHDYRYFPEPDLPPLEFSSREIETIRKQLPKLPEAKAARFVKEYGIIASQANLLTETEKQAKLFEEAVAYTQGLLKVAKKQAAHDVANWIINLPSGDRENLDPKKIGVKIYESKTKKVLGDKEMLKLAREVVSENEKAVADYRKGKLNALQFLVGCLYRKSPQDLEAQKAKRALKKVLES